MRLREVRWETFKISPASKKKIPKILGNLVSRKLPRAMKASHELWVALCSGEVYPAAEPAFPFLIEIIGISEPMVQGEILDLLLKFSTVPDDAHAEKWQRHLHILIKNERRLITKLSHSRNDTVAGKAGDLLDKIG